MSSGPRSVRCCRARFVASRVVAIRCALTGAAFRMRLKGADSPPTRAMPAPLDPYPAARPPSVPSTGPYLAWYAYHRPDSTAVFEDGHSVSYAVLARDVAKTVRELEQLGIRAGSLVGIELRPQRDLMLLLLLACEAVGATVSPLQQNDLRDDDPIAPCCDFFLLASEPLMYAATGIRIITNDFVQGLASLPNDPCDMLLLEEPTHPQRIARITRTSGTTGRPKAIPLSAQIMQRYVAEHLTSMPSAISSAVKHLCIYNFGMRGIHTRNLAVLQVGGTILFAKEEQAPGLFAAGAVNSAVFMVGDAERVAQQTPRSPLAADTLIVLIGSAVSPRLRQLIRERLGAHLSTPYATNEANLIAAVDDSNVGTLFPGVAAKIVSEAGDELPPGETGLIRVRTETMADGYYNDPELTKAAFIDGWYRTNDVGYMPAPDKLVVLGRADDMLNVGGVKIAPHSLEDELRQISGVSDAVLMTVADTAGVGALLVAVEIGSGEMPAHVGSMVRSIITRQVAHFELLPLPWFPRTGNGKVRRLEIEATFRRRQVGHRNFNP